MKKSIFSVFIKRKKNEMPEILDLFFTANSHTELDTESRRRLGLRSASSTSLDVRRTRLSSVTAAPLSVHLLRPRAHNRHCYLTTLPI